MKKNIPYVIIWIAIAVLSISIIGISLLSADDFDEERNLIDNGRYEEALQELKEEEATYNYLRTKNINNMNLYVDYSGKLSIVLELIGDVYKELNEIKLAINYYKKAKILHQLIVFEIEKNTENSSDYGEQKDFSGDEQIRIQKKIDALLNRIVDPEISTSDIDEENLSGGSEELTPIETEDDTNTEPEDTISEAENIGSDIGEEEDLSGGIEDLVPIEKDDEDINDDDTSDEVPEDIIFDDEETNNEGEIIGELVDTIPEELEEIGMVNKLDRLIFRNQDITSPIEIPLSRLNDMGYVDFYSEYLFLEYYDMNGFRIDGPQGLNNELQTGIYSSLPNWKVYKSEDGEYDLILNTDFISILEDTSEYRPEFISGTYKVEIEDTNSNTNLDREFIIYDDTTDEEDTIDNDDDTTDEEDTIDDDDEDFTIEDEEGNYVKAVITLKSGGRLTVEMLQYSNGIYRVNYMGKEFTIKGNDITDIYYEVDIGDRVRVYLENGAKIIGTITDKSSTSITLDAYQGQLNVKFTSINFMEFI